MRLKRTIFAIHPMIRNTLLLFPLLAVLLVYFLQEGISIDSLKIGNFKVEKLYLKLDNKLILRMQKLSIPKANTKESMSDIDKELKRVKRVLAFFEYIELEEVAFTDDTYSVIYADDTLYIDNSEYEIAGMMIPQNGGFVAELPLIKIKKYNLLLQGKMTYEYHTEKATFQGRYKLLNIDGNVSMQLKKRKLTFLLDSQEVSDISHVLDMFPIPPTTRSWIDKKVRARHYTLLSLQGEGSLVEDTFVLDMNHTQAKAKLKDVKIAFHKDLKPVAAASVMVRLHDNRLDFDLEKPFYQKKSMRGSQVALLNLTDKSALKLLLKLIVNTSYDQEIIDILQAYHVNIPLKQKKGTIRATLNLDIDLKQHNTMLEGRAFLSKGEITIGSLPLKTDGGEITFTSHRVAFWDVDVHDNWYQGRVNGFMNLDTQKANLKVNLQSLSMGDKKGISLRIKNKKNLSVLLQFSKGILVEVPAYHLKITQRKKGAVEINSSNIKPLLARVKGLPIHLNGGRLSLVSHQNGSMTFKGRGIWKQSYLYQRGGIITNIPFSGSYRDDRLRINLLGKKITYDSKRNRLMLSRINIDMQKMLARQYKKSRQLQKRLNVKGVKSILRYGKYVLLTDRFDLSIRGKNTTFVATKDGDKVRVEKNGNSLVVHANKIKDTMLKALLNFGGLQGGRYSLELLGQLNGELKGVIDIKGGAIQSFKAYNDLIALFNTIPALMTLSDPGFSKKGFVVRDGKIVFRIKDNTVTFDSIYLNGKSSTVAGKGEVQLSTGKLNIDLAIRTAREVGKVLGSLPLVGYILFGKDKSITTGVKITGTLDKPKAKTHPIQEALLYPLELIKRTITSPAHIINK